MTNISKQMLIGAGALAIAYWLYTRKVKSSSRQAPITLK
jgi:hypothetical protein